MKKKAMIVAGVLAAVIVAAAAAAASYQSASGPWGEDRAGRMHGTISTAMASPPLGDPGAPVTIVEFGDYQCHACHAWFHNSKPAIKRDYIDTGVASLVFVDLAFLGRDSPKAAQASHCAGDQGAYWEYHDTLYESQEEEIDGGWAGAERLGAFAFDLGLDMGPFEACMDSGKHSKRVQFNLAEARKAGATSTPTFFVVGPGGEQQKIVGAQPYSIFQQVIDSMVR